MNVLLVEPARSKAYHTKYPPLGLLKIGAHHKAQNDNVKLVRGKTELEFEPDKIYVTSLFTYAWRPVHETIEYYSKKTQNAEIIVGGIYATLCPGHLHEAFKGRIKIIEGIYSPVENLVPDYSLVPGWEKSIVFASRGCVRKCGYCSVSALEPEYQPKSSIARLIHPEHKEVVFWDNNFLASPYWETILGEVYELGIKPDFNQGLDARLIDEEVVSWLLKVKPNLIRLAYDASKNRGSVEKAIERLKRRGFSARRVLVYCLYNFDDSPSDLLERIKDILSWGAVAYPMRYEPLEPRDKSTYVSRHWTEEELEQLAKARRVLGVNGAFPPYEGLLAKFEKANDFHSAFLLRPKKTNKSRR